MRPITMQKSQFKADKQKNNILTFKNCKGGYLSNIDEYGLKVYGNSLQNGTPTPDNPIEIESVGNLITSGINIDKYAIPITICGKNLFNIYQSNILTPNDVGGFDITNKDFANLRQLYIMNYRFKSNTQYTFSCIVDTYEKESTNRLILQFYYTDGTNSTKWMDEIETLPNNQNLKITSTSGKTVKQAIFGYATSAQLYEARISNIQLEEGTTVTEYEPYKGKSATIYLDEPLRRINVTQGNYKGEYADYIDFARGVVVRYTNEKIFKGTENWSSTGNIGQTFTYALEPYPYSKGYEVHQCLCTRSTYSSGHYNVNWYTGATSWSAGGSTFMWNCGKESTVEEWKAQLAQWNEEGNPMKVVFAARKPIEDQIILPQLEFVQGTCNIFVNTSVVPQIEATALVRR